MKHIYFYFLKYYRKISNYIKIEKNSAKDGDEDSIRYIAPFL